MNTALAWRKIAERFLNGRHVSGPIGEKIRKVGEKGPLQVTEAVGPELAKDGKEESTAFLLEAIRDAVSDHALTEDEVRELTHVKRIFRVQEGDFLEFHDQEVADLLCEELERLLEDWQIEPSEAVHKVKLQGLLGLSYDQFLELTAPEIERVVIDLLYLLTAGGMSPLSAEDIARFRHAVLALDTVYDVNLPESPKSPRSGYLYCLYNPSMPKLVKIGRTSRSPEDRVSELTSATGVPEPFVLLYDLFVQDAAEAEAWVHSELESRGKRRSENREFFTVAPTEAVELMQQARDRFALM